MPPPSPSLCARQLLDHADQASSRMQFNLSRLSVAGNAPAGWDISPDLAVTMAFGALVGQMDPPRPPTVVCYATEALGRVLEVGALVPQDTAAARAL